MIKNLGIPYKGSKRRLSQKIIDKILTDNPNCKYIYDLFGGGGSISFTAIQHSQIEKVFYNEIDKTIIALYEKIKTDGITDEFYNWISRDEFHSLKNGDDWKAGLIKTIWSFGNNHRDYLYSPQNEKIKHLLHQIVVDKCHKAKDLFSSQYGVIIPDDLVNADDSINNRRLAIMRCAQRLIKGREYIPHLERLNKLQHLNGLKQLQHLEGLKYLEGLKHINSSIETSSLSYDQVSITTPIEETVIYLDPPYKNTNKYNNSICHDELAKWIKESPYTIYLSSYDFDLPIVAEFSHRCSMSAKTNSHVIEKLFCNKPRGV